MFFLLWIATAFLSGDAFKISVQKSSSPRICICLKEILGELNAPVSLDAVDEDDLLVAEQRGSIQRHHLSSKNTQLFFDLKDKIFPSFPEQFDERGLLGFALDPGFTQNGWFYVVYSSENLENITNVDHITYISRFHTKAYLRNFTSEFKNEMESEKIILKVKQPKPRNNGGHLFFGQDEALYVTIGDGGVEPYPNKKGPSVLGSIIRIPKDVLYLNQSYEEEIEGLVANGSWSNGFEILQHGLQNPWRCHEDRGHPITGEGKGRIFCADVGAYKRNADMVFYLDNGTMTPVLIHQRSDGHATIGGTVIRNSPLLQSLDGYYIFADFLHGTLHYVKENGNWSVGEIGIQKIKTKTSLESGSKFRDFILSFGEGKQGEIYILTMNREWNEGFVYQLLDLKHCNKRENAFSSTDPLCLGVSLLSVLFLLSWLL